MAMGQTCPHCGAYTFHDRGSYRECSTCGYLGWAWSHPVGKVGSGPGKHCPWCEQLTLHDLKVLRDGSVLRRCSTCTYTAIEPGRS
jgi:ssDNA-binding Zn-finger/Zn-ribbon topoisomerase 1